MTAEDPTAADASSANDPTDARPETPAAARSSAADVADEIDLDVIAADLADVEAALGRLNAGTYWTDEVTGAPIADDVLAAEPLRRRS